MVCACSRRVVRHVVQVCVLVCECTCAHMCTMKYLSLSASETSGRDELDGITQWCLHANLGEDGDGVFCHLHILLLTPAQHIEKEWGEIVLVVCVHWEGGEGRLGQWCVYIERVEQRCALCGYTSLSRKFQVIHLQGISRWDIALSKSIQFYSKFPSHNW